MSDPEIQMTARERRASDEASKLRERFNLGVAPISDVFELIETVAPGILIAVLPMPGGMDAMVVQDPERHRTVLGLATSDNPGRQRLSLAHELGHILHEDFLQEIPRDCSARTDSEKDADTFARHLLAPLTGVSQFVRETNNGQKLELRDLSRLTRHFDVSPSVIVIQLSLLKLLAAGQEEEFRKHSARSLSIRFGWLEEFKAKAVESDTPRPPGSLIERATRGYIDRLVSLNALASAAGEDPKTYQDELLSAGIFPKPKPITKPLMVSDDDFFGAGGL